MDTPCLEPGSPTQDIPGFCKSATTAEIAAHGHVLTPGRYVGAEEVEDDGDPFEEKMPRLVAELHAQFAESAKLEQAIKANLRGLGYVIRPLVSFIGMTFSYRRSVTVNSRKRMVLREKEMSLSAPLGIGRVSPTS
jgi:hypothetical protein